MKLLSQWGRCMPVKLTVKVFQAVKENRQCLPSACLGFACVPVSLI